MFIARNTPAYVVAYVVLMVPTYILPYFGSNSSMVNALSTAMGMGPTPQWWAHVWCLAMLAVLGWLRGNAIGKAFLPVFPVLAAVFDLTPGLSMIPMAPSLLHLAGIIVGAMGTAAVAGDDAIENTQLVLMRKAKIVAGVATMLAIGGTTLFTVTMSRTAKSLQGYSKPSEAKAPATMISPAQHPQNASGSNSPANKKAMPSTTPPSASAEGEARSQVPQKTATASLSQPPKAKHRRTKAQDAPKTAETKSANQEKQSIRYIRLND